jgi:hypothetical protein
MSFVIGSTLGMTSKSNMSTGNPRVVHALGICIVSFFEEPGGGGRGGKASTYIDDTGDMALHRGTSEQEIGLIIVVAKPLDILNCSQAGLAESDACVHVVLLAMLINAEAFKVNVPARTELRFNRTRNENGRFAAELGLAVLDNIEFQCDDAGHLNGTAEGNLAIALCRQSVRGSTQRGFI